MVRNFYCAGRKFRFVDSAVTIKIPFHRSRSLVVCSDDTLQTVMCCQVLFFFFFFFIEKRPYPESLLNNSTWELRLVESEM